MGIEPGNEFIDRSVGGEVFLLTKLLPVGFFHAIGFLEHDDQSMEKKERKKKKKRKKEEKQIEKEKKKNERK